MAFVEVILIIPIISNDTDTHVTVKQKKPQALVRIFPKYIFSETIK